MAKRLTNLKITSTDLVTQGANPDAHIKLFKRKDGEGVLQKVVGMFKSDKNKSGDVKKEAATFGENLERERLYEITSEMYDCTYALKESFCSIICDGELSEDGRRDMMFTSLDEFAEVIRDAIPKWAERKKMNSTETVEKSAEQQAEFALFWGRIEKALGEPAEPQTESEPTAGSNDNNDVVNKIKTTNSIQKEETHTMKIDKSKMTSEEQATLAEFEKKFGIEENTLINGAETLKPFPPELHPEVKKALDEAAEVRKSQTAEIEELRKSLEIASLTTVAKKYEIIGKKADELAPKLYDLKKAGGTVYDDYVALLDEQMAMVEKSGMFTELGRNTSGSAGVSEQIGKTAAEIKKGANGDMSSPEAVIKAFEENPDLADQYEKEYRGGK